MELVQTSSEAVTALAKCIADDLCLIDVGCSGGLAEGWRAFGSRLRAVGIDPNIGEVDRLAKLETNPKVRYVAAFAGLPGDHPLNSLKTQFSHWRRVPTVNLSYHASHMRSQGGEPAIPHPALDARSAEVREMEALRELGPLPVPPPRVGASGRWALTDVAAVDDADAASKTERNLWHLVGLVDRERTVVIPELLAELGWDNVDAIKIDVDGADYQVLHSCTDIMSSMRILAVVMEVNYFGSETDHHHTFHNTDRFMRERGFDLVKLTVREYSSSALPFPYQSQFPAQTIGGRPLQGDAFYMRDFGQRLTNSDAADFSDEKLIKCVALAALFNRQDQAAELLLRFRDRLEGYVDVDGILDLLALEVQRGRPNPRSYKDYMREFAEDHPWFYGRE